MYINSGFSRPCHPLLNAAYEVKCTTHTHEPDNKAYTSKYYRSLATPSRTVVEYSRTLVFLLHGRNSSTPHLDLPSPETDEMPHRYHLPSSHRTFLTQIATKKWKRRRKKTASVNGRNLGAQRGLGRDTAPVRKQMRCPTARSIQQNT